jgi:methyltransferase (TIGR00027 family)
MFQLSTVSETALLTLKSRIIESEKEHPLLIDPRGKEILDKLQERIPEETWERLLNRKFSPTLTRYIALRARKYDAYANEFLRERNGLVVSLGCGFDTRYWRIAPKDPNYMEVDLPEVIKLKQELVGADPGYQMIASSVLDHRWIFDTAAIQKNNVLFLAEGLFMYLPETEVKALIRKLATSFHNSQLVFETVHRKYTRGLRKKMVELKMKRNAGTAAGSAYTYGLRRAEDMEPYADNLKVSEEWSYFEEPDLKPKSMQYLKHVKAFSRTQWTIKANIA